MNEVEYKGRTVCIDRIEGYDCDAYIDEAYYLDTGEDLTDDELNELTNIHPDVIEELVFEKLICASDFLFED